MIKTLYKEHCLRYFMILEIILVVILLTFFPLSIIFFISYINDFAENIFFNVHLIYFLFKIITMYFVAERFKQINKIENENKKEKLKKRLKIITFLINLIGFIIFMIIFSNSINETINTITSF